MKLISVLIFLLIQICGFAQITVQPTSKTSCIGSSVQFILKATLSSSFQWQDSSTSGWTNLTNNATYNGVSDDTLSISGTSFSNNGKKFRCLVDTNNNAVFDDTSVVVVLTVLSNPIKAVVGNSQSICHNTSADTLRISQLASGANGNFAYQWQYSLNGSSWSNISGFTGDSLITGNLTQTTYYRVNATSTFGCGIVSSDSIRVLVYDPLVRASIGSNQSICYNNSPDTLKIVTAATGGNGLFSYQWESSSNGVLFNDITGATLQFYKSTNLTQSKYFRLKTTSSFGCGSSFSDTIFVDVLNPLSKAVIANSQSICNNSQPDTLKRVQLATGANGNFVYQWQSSLNGSSWSNISGFTGDSLITGNLSQTTYYRLNATSTFGCGTVSSDSIRVLVYGTMVPPSIGNNQIICHNFDADTLRISQPASGANGNFAYQWQYSLNGSSWSNISGFTGDSLITGNLTQTTYYRVNATSTFGCGIVSSDSIRVLVYDPLVRASIGSNQSICYNNSPDTLKIVTAATGGNGLFSYQWEISSNGVIFSDITGATLQFYKSTNLTQSKYFRLKTTSSFGCGSSFSDTIFVDVLNPLSKAVIANPQSICNNSQPDTLKRVQLATGANGNFVYQWQSSLNGSSWSNISGFTGDSLITGNLSQTTYYRLNATSTFGCGTVLSDSIRVLVYGPLVPASIGNNQNICFNSVPTVLRIISPPNGGGSSYLYQWQSSLDSVNFLNILGATSDSLSISNLNATAYYKLITTSTVGCGTQSGNQIKILVYEAFKGPSIEGNDTICYGENANLIDTSSQIVGGDKSYTYSWIKSSDKINWGIITNSNAPSYAPIQLLETTNYSMISRSGSGCGVDTSNIIEIIVNPLPDTTAIMGQQSVCKNQRDVKYKADKRSNLYTYHWDFPTGTLQYGFGLDSSIIWWGNVSGSIVLKLVQTNKITGCRNEMLLPVNISERRAPDVTRIIQKPNSNILVCEDAQSGLKYQWGYISRITNEKTDIIGANLRYVQLNSSVDTSKFIYYVTTSLNDCPTISFYNNNPQPVGLDNLIESSSYLLYPNPTTGVIIIKTNSIIDDVKIFDTNGREVGMRILYNENTVEICSHAPQGIYFVKIKSGESIYFNKISLIR